MQKRTASFGSPPQGEYLYMALWLGPYLSGALGGLLCARAAAAVTGDLLYGFCIEAGDSLSALSLFASAAVYFTLTVLLAQFPCGRALVAVLTASKGFCSAYVLGILYQFRMAAGLDTVLVRFVLHSALLLPACCALTCLCCADSERNRGLSLPFLYLAALAAIEWMIWG